MVGHATAIAVLSELKIETVQLFNTVQKQSKKAGINNQEEMNNIATMIDEWRYETARIYLEAIQDRLPN